MEYLLLAVLSIIVYAEVLPTISVIFEFIRTLIAAKITIIQQSTVHIQEDIQDTHSRMEQNSTVAMGFHVSSHDLEEEEYCDE